MSRTEHERRLSGKASVQSADGTSNKEQGLYRRHGHDAPLVPSYRSGPCAAVLDAWATGSASRAGGSQYDGVQSVG